MKFNLIRNFILSGGALLIAVFIGLGIYRASTEINHVIKIVEAQNVALGKSFANAIWEKFPDHLAVTKNLSDAELKAHPNNSEIDQTIRTLATELPVLKLKIFNTDGKNVFSTIPSDIGQDLSRDSEFGTAVGGRPTSRLERRDTFQAILGIVKNRDIIETFIPLKPDGKTTVGVLEVYGDVTAMVATIRRDTFIDLTIVLAALMFLFGALILIVGRANGIIQRQYLDLEANQDALTRLHEISTEYGQSTADRINKVVELGTKVIGLPIGIVGRIEGTHIAIDNAVGASAEMAPGAEYSTQESFWHFVFCADRTVNICSVSDSTLAGGITDPQPEFAAYAGTPIYVGDKRFGTLGFGAGEPRAAPFTASELSLIQLFASWIGGELQREQSRAARKESEKKFRTVTERAADAIFVHDLEGNFREVNQTACAMLGYDRDELLAMRVSEIEVGNSVEQVREIIGNLCELGPQTFQGVFRRKDGTTYPMEARASLADWDGQQHVVSLCRDMTERRDAEEALIAAKIEAEIANNSKSRFLASASHDLRQPLQALNIYIEILKRTQDAAQREKTIERAGASTKVLGGLLNALLDISKLEAGLVVPERVDFKIDSIFQFADEFRAVGAAKGIAFKLVPSDAVIHSDPNLLETTLRNLISNALKYTTSGKVLVGCRRRGPNLRIEVWDTGIGITPEQRDCIFEEFYQVDNDARDRDKGLGLGLSIVDRTARLLGHAIDVRSIPGKGSVFSVEVPLGDEDAVSGAVHEDGCPLNLDDKLVMLIDDDTAILESLESLLKSYGFSVITSRYTGEISNEDQYLIQRCPRIPDLIISDYRLPNGNIGADVVERLRNRLGAEIPAVILTGETSNEFLFDARRRGLNVLHKPIDGRQLLVFLGDVLTGKKPTPAGASAEVIPIRHAHSA